MADLSTTLPPSESGTVVAMMEAAARDGMNVREQVAFLLEWKRYSDYFTILLQNNPNVPGFIDLSVLNFWVALRRGWGSWRPSTHMLTDMRQLLRQSSEVDYTIQVPENRRPSEAELFRDASLPEEEHDRLWVTIGSSCPPSLCRLVQIWAIYAATVEDTRMESEGHFANVELRLDRLERIIREARCIDDRRTVRTPPGLFDEKVSESDGGIDD